MKCATCKCIWDIYSMGLVYGSGRKGGMTLAKAREYIEYSVFPHLKVGVTERSIM